MESIVSAKLLDIQQFLNQPNIESVTANWTTTIVYIISIISVLAIVATLYLNSFNRDLLHNSITPVNEKVISRSGGWMVSFYILIFLVTVFSLYNSTTNTVSNNLIAFIMWIYVLIFGYHYFYMITKLRKEKNSILKENLKFDDWKEKIKKNTGMSWIDSEIKKNIWGALPVCIGPIISAFYLFFNSDYIYMNIIVLLMIFLVTMGFLGCIDNFYDLYNSTKFEIAMTDGQIKEGYILGYQENYIIFKPEILPVMFLYNQCIKTISRVNEPKQAKDIDRLELGRGDVVKEISKKYKIYIIVSIIVILVFPFFFNFFIIGNNFYSKASNDGWISFLGSYLGGIFGGLGTLIALVVTTNETRKIQGENNQTQIKKEKKEFANNIADNIAKYITDINGYYHAQVISRNESSENTKELPKVNRVISVEIYYLLHIKLDNIEMAKELLKKLDEIHRNYCFYEKGRGYEEIGNQTELLRKLTIEFIEEYTK